VWGSTQVTEALNEYLDKCSFAVCVLTAEDLSADGRRWARQNVVHEVGLFQGRYGFDRVMLLAEEGCDFVPDTAEPFTVTFPRNGIESTFWRLNKMIKNQGFHLGQRRQGKN
jgi:predicted nucleotide-binding protein